MPSKTPGLQTFIMDRDRLLALARRGVHDPQRPMVHEDGFLD